MKITLSHAAPWMFLAVLALGLAGCKHATESPTAAVATPAVKSMDLVRVAGVESLVNDNGIHAKVLVVTQGARCLDRAPDGVPVGSPLIYFTPYFVFDVYPETGAPEFFRVGPTTQRASIVGWVPAAAVTRWDTRVGARPVRDPGRRVPPLVVYSDKEALIELLEKGSTSRKPLARARLRGGRTFMPWPIVEAKRVDVKGQVHELVRINFLGEVKGDLPSAEFTGVVLPTAGGDYRKQVRQGVRRLDLVICIDVTGSMGPHIEAARAAVRTISEQLLKTAEFKPEISFGLVAYRDHDDARTSFVTRHFDLEKDADSFLNKIAGLSADGGGDEPEALYDGVYEALNRTSWHPLAQKVVVVIADSSAHEPGDRQNPRNISRDALVQLASKPGVRAKLFGLTTGPASQSADKGLLWRQLTDLTGRTGGQCFPLKDADEVVARVRKILADQTIEVKVKATVVDKLGEGKTTAVEIARDTGLDVRKVTEVLEFLPGAGVDLSKLRAGAPTFSTGWALCEYGGLQVLDREVYLARDEVHLLLAGMNGLLAATSNPEQAAQIFGVGVDSRTNPFAAFVKAKGPEPLDLFLQARGVAVGRSSCLRFTADEIRTMSERQRAELREKLRGQVIPNLTNASNNHDLWRSRSGVEYGWISESHLP